MSEKITFTQWLANLWKGIWQVLCWIGRAFNPKYKSIFGRVCWATITVCIVVVTAIFFRAWYQMECEDDFRLSDKQRISNQLVFAKKGYSDKPGFIQNFITGEVIERGIDWIALPIDEDSLIVYSKKGKRGYMNRFNGKIAIPAKYNKAWVFSNGVAAVMQGDSVCFIDHSGKAVNDKKFAYNPKNSGYVYHGDYCAMAVDGGLMGLIDRNGNWAVEPKYQWIISEAKNFWRVREGDSQTGLWYVLNDKAQPVTEIGYPEITVSEDLGIVATLPNHLQVSYGFDGTKSDKFLLYEVEKMYYDKDEWDKDGNRLIDATTLMRYRMSDGYEGLCTVDGNLVTEPLYWEVLPLTKDTYLCRFKDASAGVIINSKGEIVKQANS